MSNTPTENERAELLARELAADKVRKPVWQGQALIRNRACDLLLLLDYVVPDNVAHYAIEDARRAMRELERKADTVPVHGWDEWKRV